jgi:hypothetical protein
MRLNNWAIAASYDTARIFTGLAATIATTYKVGQNFSARRPPPRQFATVN